jgi:hypothetical protein
VIPTRQSRVTLGSDEVRTPGRARKIVTVVLNTIGIAAAGGGLYFTVQVVEVILNLVGLTRLEPPPGTAESVAGTARGVSAFLGAFDLLFIFVFGAIAVVCFLIAAWLLEPFQRWRNWRAISSHRLASSVATHPERKPKN